VNAKARALTEEQEAEQYDFEERAAILEYEAGLPRHIAEATTRRMRSERRERERLERGAGERA